MYIYILICIYICLCQYIHIYIYIYVCKYSDSGLQIVTALARAHFRDTALLDTLSANLLRLNDRMVLPKPQT